MQCDGTDLAGNDSCSRLTSFQQLGLTMMASKLARIAIQNVLAVLDVEHGESFDLLAVIHGFLRGPGIGIRDAA